MVDEQIGVDAGVIELRTGAGDVDHAAGGSFHVAEDADLAAGLDGDGGAGIVPEDAAAGDADVAAVDGEIAVENEYAIANGAEGSGGIDGGGAGAGGEAAAAADGEYARTLGGAANGQSGCAALGDVGIVRNVAALAGEIVSGEVDASRGKAAFAIGGERGVGAFND